MSLDVLKMKSNNSLVDWPFTDPPTITPFEFEKFDDQKWRLWMSKNGMSISLILSGIYVTLIYVGQKIMAARPPLRMNRLLVLWNISLAVFSFCGFARTFPELFQVVTGPDGLHRSICVRDTFNQSSVFWAFLFTFSKAIELGDTMFLVLRKRQVIFLHWYHHITVLVMCFSSYSDYEPVLRWFGVVNMLVHFYMYSYFALRAMNFPLWRSVSITVTLFQLSQMVMGVGVNCYAIWMIKNGTPCARSQDGLKMHLAMYASYLILFLHYFYKAYICRKPKKIKAQ